MGVRGQVVGITVEGMGVRGQEMVVRRKLKGS